MGERQGTAPEGVVVVDKPANWTSHDVVARMRRLAGTRRVGHAGTLDPMATGVLVVGIGRATRLLGHISGHQKVYSATIRLGWATVSDDAQGERTTGAPASELSMDDVHAGVATLTGPILQRPSSVSAIKVAGRRAHERVRAGEDVHLRPRPVMVSSFEILAHRPDPALGALDLDVEVRCSSGTYVRALARDLGEALAVGGHLTALRRSRVGGFILEEARTIEELASELEDSGRLSVLSMADTARAAFPSVSVGEHEATAILHGRPVDLAPVWEIFRQIARSAISAPDRNWTEIVDPHAVFTASGELLALVAPNDDCTTRYLAVFVQPEVRA